MALPPVPPIWNALPPEVNTALLMAGAGPIPMAEAATAWEAFAGALEAQAAELSGLLASLSVAWTGGASERAISAAAPMVLWLQTMAEQAQDRAARASAQALSYTVARFTTPPLVEIIANHVTEATLIATNFMGVNTAAIAACEADYVRMWIQAAVVMDVYDMETAVNTSFVPVEPMTPILVPGADAAGAASTSAVVARVSASAPAAQARDAGISHTTEQATGESTMLTAGRQHDLAEMQETQAEGQASKANNMLQSGAQQAERMAVEAETRAMTTAARADVESTQVALQMAQAGVQLTASAVQLPEQLLENLPLGAQIGAQAVQLPGQLAQLPGQLAQAPLSQLSQPVQQMTSMLSHAGQLTSSHGFSRMGMLGANPVSSHPSAGGSGPRSGAGLVRAASLPGAGGSAARSPLMTKMLDKPVVASGAAAGPTVRGGSAPVGSGGGGGGAPVGQPRRDKKAESTWKKGLRGAPELYYDLDEDEDDDWEKPAERARGNRVRDVDNKYQALGGPKQSPPPAPAPAPDPAHGEPYGADGGAGALDGSGMTGPALQPGEVRNLGPVAGTGADPGIPNIKAADLGEVVQLPNGRFVAIFGDSFAGNKVGEGDHYHSVAVPVWFENGRMVIAGPPLTGRYGSGRELFPTPSGKTAYDVFGGIVSSNKDTLPAGTIRMANGDTYMMVAGTSGLKPDGGSWLVKVTDHPGDPQNGWQYVDDSWRPWTHTVPDTRPDHEGERVSTPQSQPTQISGYQASDGYVYIAADSFDRSQGVTMYRVDSGHVTDRNAWQPWTGIDWGKPGQQAALISGRQRFGELSFQEIDGKSVLSGFNSSTNNTEVRVADGPTDIFNPNTPTTVVAQGGNWGDPGKVAQNYGGYILPGSTLDDMGILVSQWNTGRDANHVPFGTPYLVGQFQVNPHR